MCGSRYTAGLSILLGVCDKTSKKKVYFRRVKINGFHLKLPPSELKIRKNPNACGKHELAWLEAEK